MFRRTLTRRSRTSKRAFVTRFGTRRSYRRRPWTTANGQSSSPFTTGIAGGYSRVRRAVGREVPLLERPSRTAVEMKYFPPVANTNTTVFAGGIRIIPQISQGTGVGERIGNRIAMKRLLIRGSLVPYLDFTGSSTTTVENYTPELAFHVVYDRSPGTTIPDVHDIFDTNDVHAMQRMDSRDRFYILYSKRQEWGFSQNVTPGTVTNSYTMSANGPVMIPISLDLPIYRPCSFREGGLGTSYGDFREGVLFIVCTGLVPPVGSPRFVGRVRLTYSDV